LVDLFEMYDNARTCKLYTLNITYIITVLWALTELKLNKK